IVGKKRYRINSKMANTIQPRPKPRYFFSGAHKNAVNTPINNANVATGGIKFVVILINSPKKPSILSKFALLAPLIAFCILLLFAHAVVDGNKVLHMAILIVSFHFFLCFISNQSFRYENH